MKRITKKSSTEKFLKKCLEVRGVLYDYSLVNYINNKTKVKIICKEHGIFEQTPNNHLRGQDCPYCKGNAKLNTEKFIEKSSKIHNNKYDYSLVDCNGSKNNIKIICKEHGIFEQTPNNHLKGQDCPNCIKIDSKKFINRCNIIHNNKYDYSLVSYYNMNSRLDIICKEHGVFNQIAHSHIYGVGCPICKISKGERDIIKILKDNNVSYIREYKFTDCKFIRELKFDFYLPNNNICIEFNGRQHYEPIEYFGGVNMFNNIQKRDNIKKEFCEKMNIKLINIKYNECIEDKIKQIYEK